MPVKNLTIIIPAYNEEKSIAPVLKELKEELAALTASQSVDYEIIAVNDGSSDSTKNILESLNEIIVINHPDNKGYGAALKSGIKKAKHDWVLFFDADGQHNPVYIKNFLAETENYELITGDRSAGRYRRPLLRKPGLWLLTKIANYLVDCKIPDINCGFRLVRKEFILNYLHLMPDGFSFSTTSTLAFLKDKRNVKFLPVEISKRNNGSKSTVKPRHAFTVFMLIFRLVMTFSPLRIFLPASLILFLAGFSLLIYDLAHVNITETTIFILITSLLIFFFGLLADQMAALRREINRK